MPNQAIASEPPFHDIFVPRNIPFSKISDDVITRNLRFAPPNVHTPIKNSGHACGVLLVVILTVLLAKALFKKTMQKNNKWVDGYKDFQNRIATLDAFLVLLLVGGAILMMMFT